jgi:hypothetical protein
MISSSVCDCPLASDGGLFIGAAGWRLSRLFDLLDRFSDLFDGADLLDQEVPFAKGRNGFDRRATSLRRWFEALAALARLGNQAIDQPAVSRAARALP